LQAEHSLCALDSHYQAMPPVAAMQLRIAGYDGNALILEAPLALHVNDKGCAFGGSLVSLLTLVSWGLVTLHVQQSGLDADVFVADSEVRYLAPLFADLRAQARIAEGASWDGFIATLRERGRARTTLVATVPLPDGGVATTFRARYVAIARKRG
jgi:thioesterase domain-containing protein